ncbi:MAG: glutamate--tRNA ligase [Micavibrio aeruginosavorus]|uniref:Glutamate--tRNA ligase n=1 Tax=Micavibrio aeruginosavorus TaxID=349221 RepID=A0A7T5R0M4_9BACT|nr:MAG: glutamate--tRNA ligase [Micavibrio aeruginosavorus]
MTVVTRIPPSPTGLMHIGTARTALYNWLFAQHYKGQMQFRIEDTDRARYAPEFVESIKDGLTWLGLTWDGPILSQFERRDRHAEVAHEMLKAGKAYYCYCSPEELETMREKAKAEGSLAMYDRRWRDSTATPPAGVKPVIRIKAPIGGASVVNDRVQGEVTVNNEQLDDFIILRSDGTPTYMLAVVVDDHDMGVTHVIRGDDHLNNTFRQNIIYEAMDWNIPVYAHLPLILGPDGAKLSKRHGATAVAEYANMGYLPEAMRNYLLRLGWSHGDDEIISTEQAIEWFDLDHVHRSPARFDFAKLENVNAHYMKEADNRRLVDLVVPFIEKKGIKVDHLGRQRLLAGMDELKNRAKTLLQMADEGAFYCKSVPLDFDEKAKANLDPAVLKALAEKFNQLESFTPESIELTCKEIANDLQGGKLGKVAMPLRAALTGTTVSPSVFHAAVILGKDEVLRRLSCIS